MQLKRRCSAIVLIAIVAAVAGAPFAAAAPPTIDTSALPADSTSPITSFKQDKQCAPSSAPTSAVNQTPPALDALNVPDAWRFSRGAGVTVALLSTGVERHFRLPLLTGGGDYVGGGDGLTDCDSFGTLIAGVIAGSASPSDKFSGVAPEAEIMSLRVSSEAYRPESSSSNDPNQSEEAIYARTLATAIVHAVNSGADVIAVPRPACLPADKDIDRAALGAAVHYATTKNVLVVASSGNVVGVCEQNPPYRANPSDPRGWNNITTVSTPSEFSDVLSVGMTTLTGEPTDKTLQGPWLGIGAPGTGFVTTANDGAALTSSVQSADGTTHELAGSAYATAIVAGTAALVRSRYPSLSASEVKERLANTAHHPPRGTDNFVGAGLVDPVTALTGNEPPREQYLSPAQTRLRIPPPPPPADPAPVRNAVIISIAALLLAVGIPAATKLAQPRKEQP